MPGQSERQHGFCSRRLNWENAQFTQWDRKYLVQIKTPMDVTRARAHYVAHACVYMCACVCVCVCACVRVCVCVSVCEREREGEREREWVCVSVYMYVSERENMFMYVRLRKICVIQIWTCIEFCHPLETVYIFTYLFIYLYKRNSLHSWSVRWGDPAVPLTGR